MTVDDEMIDLLVELGLIASGYRLTGEANTIAAALQRERPDSTRPHLIRAMSQLNAGNAAGAVRELHEQALKIDPRDIMVKAFLALALHVEGRATERDRIAGEVLEQGGDAAAVALAQSLMHA